MTCRNYTSELRANAHITHHDKEIEKNNGSWYQVSIQSPGTAHAGEISKEYAKSDSSGFLWIFFNP